MRLKETPTPGSDEAIGRGCCCPVLDNSCGRGWRGIPGVYVMSANCPLHGVNCCRKEWQEKEKRQSSPD